MFGIHDYPAFCGAVLLFLALPGPGTLALLRATALQGMRGAAAATFGILVGDQVLMWLAVAGVATLLQVHPAWFQGLQWLGATYLAWIGMRLLSVRTDAPTGLQLDPGHFTRQALLITLLNPKAIMFYMAFLPLFIDPPTHRGTMTFAAMAVTVAVLTALYALTLCAVADRLATRLRRHRGAALAMQRVAGLSLIAFGLRLAWR